MNLAIYKYPLADGLKAIAIQGFKKIVSIRTQGDNIVMYALVDRDLKAIENNTIVYYAIYGTGHDIPKLPIRPHFTTITLYDDKFVLHVVTQEDYWYCQQYVGGV